MAEFLVIMDQESNNLLKGGIGKWSGAEATSEVLLAPKRAMLLTLEAASAAEAVRGAKQLFPGWVKGKSVVVEKAATEEL